ncbi:hypothetical protein SY89_00545 [Halolamina pelagica]|uniref:DUF7835 domain-containing protein n=1 Tax=Halolamina pelagica TaxID=699431 RepID=A0A0N8HZL3_9EURY|nr:MULTISPECIES: hypothetical protein [Halolamina]KPN29827.1 hypothetical protein SY89_00545 [Halolamina pelagica]
MATQPSDPDNVRESCPECDGETIHDVRVEIRTESDQQENSEFSREPYRVAVCQTCDSQTATRMNNA